EKGDGHAHEHGTGLSAQSAARETARHGSGRGARAAPQERIPLSVPHQGGQPQVTQRDAPFAVRQVGNPPARALAFFYSSFNRKFRYSIFIGGPTCTCTPISPFIMRPAASSSITTLIKCPFSM